MSVNKMEFQKGDNGSVSVKLSNTGGEDGAEVLQLYSHDNEAEVLRPEKELRAFKKVFLKAGEQNIVKIEFPVDKLSYFDEETDGWKLEPGDHLLMVGNASDNIQQTTNIAVN
jgi:beta-glucosidase